MPTNLLIQVPDSLKEYHDQLLDFFKGMIKKLDKNSYKDTPTTKDLPEIMDMLLLEVDEFEEQLAINKFDENSLVELMDQANFSFLAYVVLRNEGVKHEEEGDSELGGGGLQVAGGSVRGEVDSKDGSSHS